MVGGRFLSRLYSMTSVTLCVPFFGRVREFSCRLICLLLVWFMGPLGPFYFLVNVAVVAVVGDLVKGKGANTPKSVANTQYAFPYRIEGSSSHGLTGILHQSLTVA